MRQYDKPTINNIKAINITIITKLAYEATQNEIGHDDDNDNDDDDDDGDNDDDDDDDDDELILFCIKLAKTIVRGSYSCTHRTNLGYNLNLCRNHDTR